MHWFWIVGLGLVIGGWFVFFHKGGSNLGGFPPTTIWEDIKSGKIHLPILSHSTVQTAPKV